MSKSVTADPTITRNTLTAAWGAFGVVAVCAYAIWRLAHFTLDALAMPFNAGHWAVFVANIVFMAWSEGYRGFQQKFSPRTAARVLYLYRTPTRWWTRLLAPLFCFGYFHASRRILAVTWSVTTGIVILVLLVHQLNQPWRGIIDAGVVVGLSWGVVSLLACYIRAFGAEDYPVSPEVR